MAASARHIVMVVEDEALVRMDVADELRDVGCVVIEAYHAEDALHVLNNILTVHLVLTDIQMPGDMDGLGLVRWLKLNRPEIRRAVYSGSRDALATASDLCDRELVFAKPANTRHVARAIAKALGTARPNLASGAA